LLVDEIGNSYVGGSISFIYPNRDYLITKYNYEGDIIWTQRYNYTGTNSDFLNSLTKDRFDNIIVTGQSGNSPGYKCATVKYTQTVGINLISTQIPVKIYLEQNYPNPFNPVTNIRFSLPENLFVNMKIYNSSGKQVSNLVNQNLSAGTYETTFDASQYPSGIYFYKLSTGDFSETKRMVLIK